MTPPDFTERWPDMRMKHLELVQSAVTRMGSNSAALKGYAMGVVAALIALAGAIDKPRILLLALPIMMIFAFLDAAYLTLERGFRNHYNDLRLRDLSSQPDFDVVTAGQGSIIAAFFSWSVLGFYGSASAIMIGIWTVM